MSVMHNKPHAAGHADAVDARDCGLGGVLRQPQQIGEVDIGSGKILRERAAGILQVRAGAKRLLPCPGQHDHAHGRIVMRGAIALARCRR